MVISFYPASAGFFIARDSPKTKPNFRFLKELNVYLNFKFQILNFVHPEFGI